MEPQKQYDIHPRLKTSIDDGLAGNEAVNEVTRQNPDVAHVVADAIKADYERALEYIQQMRQYDDNYMQSEIAKGAELYLDVSNRRAARIVQELGYISLD